MRRTTSLDVRWIVHNKFAQNDPFYIANGESFDACHAWVNCTWDKFIQRNIDEHASSRKTPPRAVALCGPSIMHLDQNPHE